MLFTLHSVGGGFFPSGRAEAGAGGFSRLAEAGSTSTPKAARHPADHEDRLHPRVAVERQAGPALDRRPRRAPGPSPSGSPIPAGDDTAHALRRYAAPTAASGQREQSPPRRTGCRGRPPHHVPGPGRRARHHGHAEPGLDLADGDQGQQTRRRKSARLGARVAAVDLLAQRDQRRRRHLGDLADPVIARPRMAVTSRRLPPGSATRRSLTSSMYAVATASAETHGAQRANDGVAHRRARPAGATRHLGLELGVEARRGRS